MDKFKIYTAGAVKNVTKQQASKWREELFNKFSTINNDVSVFIPSEFFSYTEKKHKKESQPMEYYLDYVIPNMNIVIVNLDNSAFSCGTCMEARTAKMLNIPIIGLKTREDDVQPEIEDYCAVVFDNIKELVDYINDYYVKVYFGTF